MNSRLKFASLILLLSVLFLSNVVIASQDGDMNTYGVNTLIQEDGNVYSNYLEVDLTFLNDLNIVDMFINEFNNFVKNKSFVGFNA